MRLFTLDFVSKWHLRILNIHPALLPAFKGLDTHKRALQADAKIHGATVHYVVPEMDPDRSSRKARSRCGQSTAKTLAMRVLEVEHRIYPLALKLVAEGRVTVENGGCLIDGIPVADGTDLVPDDVT